jgi:pimeloyl-ACP methyl ester carboxylesterase
MADYYDGWVLAGGVRTHYAWAGTSGPAVVLLHGGGPGSSGAAGWRFMLPALAQAGFRVLAPDQLSMGQTDARPHAWPVLGHQSLVNHVAEFLAALCLDQVALVGNSQGAYVAVKLALDHPQHVTKLFLIGSATIADAMGMPRRGPNAGMQALLDYDYSESAMRRFMEAIVYRPAQVSDELIRARHEMANLPGVRDSRTAFDAGVQRRRQDAALAGQFSLRDRLPNLATPAIFAWGECDTFAPTAMGRELETLLPNIPFHFIPEAGHQVQTDQPEIINGMVIDWLRAAPVEVNGRRGGVTTAA